MAGLVSAINSATAGLRTIQADLKLVSDNVARSEDPTRTRHSLDRQTGPTGQIIGIEYQRRSDVFLAAEVNLAISNEGKAGAQNEYMTRIGQALGTSTGEPAVAVAMEQFTSAWRALQTTPESDTAKFQVIQLGERVALELRRAAGSVDQIEADLKADLAESVNDINRYLDDINRINRDIIATGSEGSVANELRDRRDEAVRGLNELVGVKSVERPDGRISVFTATGLQLIDTDRIEIVYDGDRTISMLPEVGLDIHPHFGKGKVGALLGFLADSSTTTPSRTPSQDPTQETIRKLRDQLDAIAAELTGQTKTGEPTSFADAYDGAQPTETGELSNSFFIGSDRFEIRVNAALLDGSLELKESAIDAAADAINAGGRSFTATGLTLSNVEYSGMVSGVLSHWSNAAAVAEQNFDQSSQYKELVEVRYHSKVGVNLDEEIAALQELQTSYAAVARVLQVANTMFDTLESIVA